MALQGSLTWRHDGQNCGALFIYFFLYLYTLFLKLDHVNNKIDIRGCGMSANETTLHPSHNL